MLDFMKIPPNTAAEFTTSGSTLQTTWITDWKEVFFQYHGYAPNSAQDQQVFIEPTKQRFTFEAFPGLPGIPEKQRRYLFSLPPPWLLRFRNILNWIDVQASRLARFKRLDSRPCAPIPKDIKFHSKLNEKFTPCEDSPEIEKLP